MGSCMVKAEWQFKIVGTRQKPFLIFGHVRYVGEGAKNGTEYVRNASRLQEPAKSAGASDQGGSTNLFTALANRHVSQARLSVGGSSTVSGYLACNAALGSGPDVCQFNPRRDLKPDVELGM
jgi:hypothetical protein